MIRIAAFAFTILTLAGPAMAAEPPLARTQEVIQSCVSNKLFMSTVLAHKDGKPVLDKAYGSAGLESNIPNTTAKRIP